ncbi:MAG: SDR family NAD(P)-dependent oxidoreductase [Comamonadaceae bacterium]|nr:SDR family NAD(P)-dependent oxidoreductase [Comamonadaceae bacterium]
MLYQPGFHQGGAGSTVAARNLHNEETPWICDSGAGPAGDRRECRYRPGHRAGAGRRGCGAWRSPRARSGKARELAAEIGRGRRPARADRTGHDAEDASRTSRRRPRGLGQVDILVNNAGGSRAFKDLHVSEEQWQEAMTLNFHRPRQLADALIDPMIARRWGRIVNITGKSEPEHVNGAFCAKAGMHSWAKGLSRMVGKHGVTMNCVPPGRIHPSRSCATRLSTGSGSATTDSDGPLWRA